jgi:hypothetical protein
MKRSFIPPALALLAALSGAAHADGVRPQRFGPFLQQSLAVQGNPAGADYVFPSGAYNFQAGWMEPIAILPWPVFKGSYIETQGNATLSPWQYDFGIAFNLKPLRFLEFGLAYNRLVYPYSLAGFTAPEGAGSDWRPTNREWQPPLILAADKLEAAGTDIFTYQANLTFELGPLQLHGGGSYGMWDVDTRQDVVLEYRTGLLIRPQDRIGSAYLQTLVSPGPESSFLGFTARGWAVRNQYGWTVQTKLDQNLLSTGFIGLRRGWNDDRQYRGLDGWVGFWTKHPQLEGRQPWQRVNVSLQWTWNIQILNLTDH